MTRTDYRRGREAVAVLAGRRAASLPVSSDGKRQRSGLRRLAAAGAVAAAVMLSFVASSSFRPLLEPPRNTQTGVSVGAAAERMVARSTGTVDPSSLIELREHRYPNWDAARAAVDLTLKEPAWTPNGFSLSALQSFVPEVAGSDVTPQSIVASFSGPDGSDAYYWIDQFAIATPAEFDIARTLPVAAPDLPHGVIEVGGLKALWSGGMMTLDDAGQPAGWDRSVTVLTWSDGDLGYRLEGKGVSLADLVRVAESLR